MTFCEFIAFMTFEVVYLFSFSYTKGRIFFRFGHK